MQTAHSQTVRISIGRAIAQARRIAGMKQSTAAKALGIVRPTLSGYENGRYKGLTINLLVAMSQLYQQPFESFL